MGRVWPRCCGAAIDGFALAIVLFITGPFVGNSSIHIERIFDGQVSAFVNLFPTPERSSDGFRKSASSAQRSELAMAGRNRATAENTAQQALAVEQSIAAPTLALTSHQAQAATDFTGSLGVVTHIDSGWAQW